MVSNKDEGDLDFKEFILIFQTTESKIMKDSKIEELILELQKNPRKLFLKVVVHFGVRTSRQIQI